MTRFLAVAAGGAVGAVARYAVALLVAAVWRREFPLATFLINISGSFAIGFVVERAAIDPLIRLLLITGFLGAYTTFSTFEYEAWQLAQGRAFGLALLNLVASVAAGFVAVHLGVMLARR